MTRSVTIVNTSNWDNEVYYVDVVEGEGDDQRVGTYCLKVGEHVRLYPREDHVLRFREYTPETSPAAPFLDPQVEDGKRKDRQVWPRVRVEFGCDQ